MTDEFVMLPHPHSFTQRLIYEQKKTLRESERKRAVGRERGREGGSRMLKYELQTRAAPSGPRKHTS